MSTMTISRMRVVFREMGNSFIGHLRHIPCIVVRMVPESLIWGKTMSNFGYALVFRVLSWHYLTC